MHNLTLDNLGGSTHSYKHTMRRTINAAGELVEVGSNDTTTAPLVSNSGTIDFFGFNLEWTQFLVALVLASLLLGIEGGMALLIALGAYTAFTRATATTEGTSSSGSSGSNNTSSANRWTRPTGGGSSNPRGGGSNIRGISDLPCDPKRG